jgi:hypothetical protein
MLYKDTFFDVVERNECCWTLDGMKYMNSVHGKDLKFVMLHLVVRIVAI